MEEWFAGFDIGGTKTLALVVERSGRVGAARRLERPRGPEATVDQLVGLLDVLQDEVGAPVRAMGVGIAGAISRAGVVRYSPNLPELFDFPLRELLYGRLDLPVVVDNDATAATWAEYRVGAGRHCDDLLYVALGTGIGAGYVLDGRLYRGANGFAGEAGHMVIDRRGDAHITGARGPWEMYASGNGLGSLARSWAADGRLDSVRRSVSDLGTIRGEHVAAAVGEGDPAATALLGEFARGVAVGLTNLIYVLDPAQIVIGGGLVEIGEPLRSAIEREVDAMTLGREQRPATPIALAELGSRSAALGAALLAIDLV